VPSELKDVTRPKSFAGIRIASLPDQWRRPPLAHSRIPDMRMPHRTQLDGQVSSTFALEPTTSQLCRGGILGAELCLILRDGESTTILAAPE